MRSLVALLGLGLLVVAAPTLGTIGAEPSAGSPNPNYICTVITGVDRPMLGMEGPDDMRPWWGIPWKASDRWAADNPEMAAELERMGMPFIDAFGGERDPAACDTWLFLPAAVSQRVPGPMGGYLEGRD